MHKLSRWLVDPERQSIASWTRGRRFDALAERYPRLSQMSVLDLGGEVHTWLSSPVRPRSVTLLNLDWKAAEQQSRLKSSDDGTWMSAVAGDACDPPAALRDQRFDLVFSNSVIEHVGGHQRRRRFAHWARALGESYWVQTPNRWFAVEPHWLCPFVHWTPPAVRAHVMRRWPLGAFHNRDTTFEESLQEVLWIELLTAGELLSYFPGADLIRERVAGTTKSLIATAPASSS
jgi:hypothetical protein